MLKGKEEQLTLHIKEGNEKFQQYEHRLTEHTVKIKNLEREVFKQ